MNQVRAGDPSGVPGSLQPKMMRRLGMSAGALAILVVFFLIGTTPFTLTQNLITACCGMVGVGAAMIGYCLAPMRWWERIWFMVGGLMLIDLGTLTDVIGIATPGIGLVYQSHKSKTLGSHETNAF